MRKSTAFALLAIFLFAVLVRLLPLTIYLFWGADIGEYYHIISQLASNGFIPDGYGGWGFSYPMFPGMEIVVAGASLLGMETSAALSLLIPVLASLVVFPIFMITVEATGDARAGLVAAAFISAVMPHAYATSHAMPASLGDFLLVACLLLFLKWSRNPKFGSLLFPTTLVLIVTHHLSTYFLLIGLVSGIFLVQLVRNRTSLRVLARELAYVVFTVAATALFWFVANPRFAEDVFSSESPLPPLVLLGALVAAALAGLAVIWARRRFVPHIVLTFPTYRRTVLSFSVVFLTSVSILLVNALVVVPGTTMTLTPLVAVMFLPLVIFISFAGPGSRPMAFLRAGIHPFAWTIAIALSTLAGVAISSRALLPYRHMEYLMIPIAILAGLGVVHLFGLVHFPQKRRRAAAAAAVVLGLVVTNAAVAFPPRDLLGGWEEGSRPESISLAAWAGEHVDGLVAADHRVSSLIFGWGKVDATWDTATLVFHAEDFDDARDELQNVSSPSGDRRATYVAFDGDTAEGVSLYPWDPAEPMGAEAVRKFDEAPFHKVYDDGYSRLFHINWGLT